VSAGTARAASLACCHTCGKLASDTLHACPRCGAGLHLRKPSSLQRTWALLIVAMVLYIPANVYPVMSLEISGKGEPHTILGGVIELFEAGSYGSGALVLIASITVPLAKMLGLGWLLFTVQRRSSWRPRDRTRLYRAIETVGRWSMIDMFMVSILVALVNLGALAQVTPGVGAPFFCLVVIATMVAASSFDPRLIWDNSGEPS
jgi:paraquat-inducible protein A